MFNLKGWKSCVKGEWKTIHSRKNSLRKKHGQGEQYLCEKQKAKARG
jgi:hypothetical protein